MKPRATCIAALTRSRRDVRIGHDGRSAYISDSGEKGALMVVDLESGHPSTQPKKDIVVKADGEELRRPDGRDVQFAADGIALSHDGRQLYWQAIKGKTLYRVETGAPADPRATRR